MSSKTAVIPTPKYKKYIVMQDDEYYPQPGLDSISGSFNTQKEAQQYIYNDQCTYNSIIDRDNWELVEYI